MGRFVSGDTSRAFTAAPPFTSSGTWTHPEPGVLYEVMAEIIAGGGGGASGDARLTAGALMDGRTNAGFAGIAGSRHTVRFFTSKSEAVTVGAGGVGGPSQVRTASTSGVTSGVSATSGGRSSFGRFFATGGAGGGTNGSLPTSVASTLNASIEDGSQANLTEEPSVTGVTATSLFSNSFECFGGAGTRTHVGTSAKNGGAPALTTNADATAVAGENANATDYGAPGAGGGGACAQSISASRTARSGKGGDGAQGIVRVWFRRA